jgi:hypothetical protein
MGNFNTRTKPQYCPDNAGVEGKSYKHFYHYLPPSEKEQNN